MAYDISRGDIYWVERREENSHVQAYTRPAIIVSNDTNNRMSKTLEVVFLTTKEKPPLPTHCAINSASRPSTAICEQITTIDEEDLQSYIGYCTRDEMEEVDRCLMISLGLNKPATVAQAAPAAREEEKNHNNDLEVFKLKSELELMKQLYADLLNRSLTK